MHVTSWKLPEVTGVGSWPGASSQEGWFVGPGVALPEVLGLHCGEGRLSARSEGRRNTRRERRCLQQHAGY